MKKNFVKKIRNLSLGILYFSLLNPTIILANETAIDLIGPPNAPPTNQEIYNSNIVNLGEVEYYRVLENDKDMKLSRNGSIAQSVENGTIINQYGSYNLVLKETNKIIKFQILPNKEEILKKEISSDEDLFNALLFAMEDGNVNYEFKVNPDYKNNEKLKADIKYYNKRIHDLYPITDYRGYSLSIYKDKFTISYDRRMNNDFYQETTLKTIQKLDNVISKLDLTKSDIELEKEIVDFIIQNYAYYDDEDPAPPESLTRTIQAAYLGNEFVCSGYAKTAMYLLNNIGIPTQYITGKIIDGTSHAWNIVELDEEFYHLDLTWADSEEIVKNNYYSYVNEKDSFMSETHIWKKEDYPPCVFNTYLNIFIYDIQEIDENNLKAVDLNKPIVLPTTDDVKISNTMQKLSNALNKSFSYYKFKKYNRTVIVFV